ncbi:hypothetical protein LF1_12340 [Rubripirellula obstinata]|uniref:Bacterial type II secretion system protein F domain protein n=1 Tax=Rubripirellula obstinata TaxID=406547 RepID=A0A5B1CEQ7_9BACT|nr:hypothetical protein [Rubripirellula obstinata]KAA1258711.1 hypothetical protein LF1_12340 [Rubripirellula obstinata]
MSRTIRVLLWIILIALIGLTFIVLLPSILGIVLTMLLIFGVSDFIVRRRHSTVDSFNSVLKTVVDHGGDLTSVAVAYSRSGPISAQAYEFARRLMMGQEPLEAAARSRIPLQLSTAVAMQTKADGAGTNAGNHSASNSENPNSVKQFVAKRLDNPMDLRSIRFAGTNAATIHGRLMYLFITASITLAVLSFMTVFIKPPMKKMFKEFGLGTDNFWWQLSLAPAVMVYLLIIGLIFCFILLSRSSFLGVGLPSWLPTMPRLAMRKSELLHGLADAVDVGWPIGRALSVAHTISIDSVQRQRLQQAMEWIEQGRSPAEAIRWAGWIDSKDVGWIEDAPSGRLGTLLRAAGDRRVRDSVFNLGWIINLVFPVLILILAGVVTVFCHGFLSSLMQLITGLA